MESNNMNERIYELSKIAYTNHLERNPHSSFGRRYDYDKEFAELIVRECVDIADGQKKYVEDMVVFNEHDANWNKARIQQSQQIVDKIKQHFGVEE
jgi:hypothetical protein